MSRDSQPMLIEVEPEPIPGTHLHRRRQGEREILPEYRGPGQNERAAIDEAALAGFSSVAFDGRSYVRLGGTWYVLNL
jgi:hypothetical protein